MAKNANRDQMAFEGFAAPASLRLDDAMWKRLTRIYRAGLEHMPDAGSWYADCFFNIQNVMIVFDHNGHPLLDTSKERTELFVDLLAATSPQASIARNTFLATQLFQMIRHATLCEFPNDFEAHLNNECRCFVGLPMSGPKVTAFRANLLGENKPVTVDSWMMRVFMQAGKKAPESPAEYQRMEEMIRTVARRYNQTPSAMQAILWVGIKILEGAPEDTPEPFEHTLAELMNPRKKGQEEIEFVNAPAEAVKVEKKLAVENRSVRLNKGDGFTSVKIIAPRLREILMRETNLDANGLVKVLCEQAPGDLMTAILYCRHRMNDWRRSAKAGRQAVEELQFVISMEGVSAPQMSSKARASASRSA